VARLTGVARRGSCRTQWLLRVEGVSLVGAPGAALWRAAQWCSRVTFSPGCETNDKYLFSTGRVFTSLPVQT
jgi:hypothetical protein